MRASTPRLLVVGSVALDTIATPAERRANVLGGSAAYACAAAAHFTATAMVGVVGRDFPASGRALFRRLGIDLRGLQTAEGRTFRWSGEYFANMNERRTLSTELNVFADFRPELPPDGRRAPYVFLGNIAPALQSHVLDQMARRPRFVMADTMDLWIRTAREELRRLIARVDLLTLNESEARELSSAASLARAARALLRLGPRFVLVKRGEYGSVLFANGATVRVVPACLLERVRDPTGAGDTFAGGLMGWIAHTGRTTIDGLVEAMVRGTALASFAVESFGVQRLATLRRSEIHRRVRELRRMAQLS